MQKIPGERVQSEKESEKSGIRAWIAQRRMIMVKRKDEIGERRAGA